MGDLARLLKESWSLVEEHQEKVAGYFYARMFLSYPDLRDLFPVQMDLQRSRLLHAIVTAVQTLGDPEKFDDYLRGANVEPLDGVDVDWLAPSEDGSGLVAASFHTANGLVRID